MKTTPKNPQNHTAAGGVHLGNGLNPGEVQGNTPSLSAGETPGEMQGNAPSLSAGETSGEMQGNAPSLSAGETHFHRFGLPISYHVDAQALEKAYEEQCFATHPDFLQGASETAQTQALEQIAAVNHAYQVLLDENSRSAYLLTLLGQGQDLHPKALPPGFLEEMLLLQEEVEEAADNPKANAALKRQVEQRCQHCVEERTRLFSAISPLQPNVPMVGDTLQKIGENLNVERYLQRILEMLP